ncbi:MAG: ATP-grasp domain-containing protein [Rhizobacter sp.]
MYRHTSSHAIVLDPFSSGRFLADEFARRGIRSVAVLSGDIPALFAASFEPKKYAAVIKAGDPLDELVAALAPFNPCCVMTGLETGIELMDALAARFRLPGNDPATSAVRRDKYLMQETIRAQGLRAVAQCKVERVEQAEGWLDDHGRYPVVVKPAASAGSDNINLCANRQEALAAVARVLRANNLFGAPNTHALVQEYLDGPEWVVDTVSCDGDCLVNNVTKYKKLPNAAGKTVYRHSAFLTPDMAEHGELIRYTQAVVASLGIARGAAHVELIVTAQGPVLVEVNARMHGGDAVDVLRDYAPYTQLQLSVDAHIAPDEFKRKAERSMVYSRHVVAHFLISRIAGEVRQVMDKARLAQIASVVGDHLPHPGDKLVVTDSLTSAPGYLWLANESQTALQSDQSTLVEWEEEGLLYS